MLVSDCKLRNLFRLQERFGHRYEDKEHYEWIIITPAEAFERRDFGLATGLEGPVLNKRALTDPFTSKVEVLSAEAVELECRVWTLRGVGNG